jgi:hypothetical protein
VTAARSLKAEQRRNMAPVCAAASSGVNGITLAAVRGICTSKGMLGRMVRFVDLICQ